MLYFVNVFYVFFYGRLILRPWLTEVRENFTRTWWTLSVIREVSSWIFYWSPLNYRVGQKVTKFGVGAYFQTAPANFLLSLPNVAEYCNSEKKTPRLVNFGLQTPEIHALQNS